GLATAVVMRTSCGGSWVGSRAGVMRNGGQPAAGHRAAGPSSVSVPRRLPDPAQLTFLAFSRAAARFSTSGTHLSYERIGSAERGMTWPALTAGSFFQVASVMSFGWIADVRSSIMMMSASYLSMFSQLRLSNQPPVSFLASSDGSTKFTPLDLKYSRSTERLEPET